MQISGTLLISNPPRPIKLSSQSTAGVRLWSGFNQLSEHLVQKCRAKTKIYWDKSGCFDFSYSINFFCRTTYWAMVELLSCPTLKLKMKSSKTLFIITLILDTFFFVTHFFKPSVLVWNIIFWVTMTLVNSTKHLQSFLSKCDYNGEV